jgi:hypothetical protein
MLSSFVLVIQLLGQLLKGIHGVSAAEYSPFIQDEIFKLESFKPKLNAEQAQELSELYFLTGRCSDALKIKKDLKNLITCACGGGCPNTKDPNDKKWVEIFALKRKSEKGALWRNSSVQKHWKNLREDPDAKYWAFKILSGNAKQDPVLRSQLEQALESFNVNP